MKHPHAELARLYADDMMISLHPMWCVDTLYRRKVKTIKTIKINGFTLKVGKIPLK